VVFNGAKTERPSFLRCFFCYYAIIGLLIVRQFTDNIGIIVTEILTYETAQLEHNKSKLLIWVKLSISWPNCVLSSGFNFRIFRRRKKGKLKCQEHFYQLQKNPCSRLMNWNILEGTGRGPGGMLKVPSDNESHILRYQVIKFVSHILVRCLRSKFLRLTRFLSI